MNLEILISDFTPKKFNSSGKHFRLHFRVKSNVSLFIFEREECELLLYDLQETGIRITVESGAFKYSLINLLQELS